MAAKPDDWSLVVQNLCGKRTEPTPQQQNILKQDGEKLGKTFDVNLWPTHIFAYTCMHICAHTNTVHIYTT